MLKCLLHALGLPFSTAYFCALIGFPLQMAKGPATLTCVELPWQRTLITVQAYHSLEGNHW